MWTVGAHTRCVSNRSCPRHADGQRPSRYSRWTSTAKLIAEFAAIQIGYNAVAIHPYQRALADLANSATASPAYCTARPCPPPRHT